MFNYEKKILQTSRPFNPVNSEIRTSRTIYYGEVFDVNDNTDGGRIKVRIPDLDNRISNDDLNWCYPIRPKFFHAYPKVGEIVRVFIEDIKYPYRNRYWEGSIISQPHKINFDARYTALSTTNMGLLKPDDAPSRYPDAKGVFPDIEDIAIIGRENTDVVLKINEVHIRAGKHEKDDILKLNIKNPAEISLVYENNTETNKMTSNTLILSDKIGLISHDGNPKFKAARLDIEDRERIFNEGHPIARGDVLVEALKLIRKVIIGHIHGYSGLPADKDQLINELDNIDFTKILQKNIVIN